MPIGNDPIDGCGISKIWMTSTDDPFKPACNKHDIEYNRPHAEGTEDVRFRTDRQLLTGCLRVAGSDILLKAKAYLFYGIVRSIGWLWW